MISPDTIISIVVHAARGAGTRKTKQNGGPEGNQNKRRKIMYIRTKTPSATTRRRRPVFTVDRRLPVIRLFSGDVNGGYPVSVPPADPSAVAQVRGNFSYSNPPLLKKKVLSSPRVCLRKRHVNLDARSNVNSHASVCWVASPLVCSLVITLLLRTGTCSRVDGAEKSSRP